jgi:hypothetical protein
MCGEIENSRFKFPPMRYNVPNSFSPILHIDQMSKILKCGDIISKINNGDQNFIWTKIVFKLV